MAHLTIEYSANLETAVDMQAFCELARQAMAESGLMPLAGIRVRAFRAEHTAVADGDPANAFADMVLRMGPGRSEDQRMQVLELVYGRLETWLESRLAHIDMPFALSLEILELNYPFAEKRMNTIRTALMAKGMKNV